MRVQQNFAIETNEKCGAVPQHVVKSDVVSVAEFFKFVAHVLEQQLVALQVNLESVAKQTQQKSRPTQRNNSL